ncbi:MAG: SixA phosphatase family protein [Candidatus Puniceispirillaceae bacterium]
MLTLYLVRHAKAEPIADSDEERTLTASGKDDATHLGALFKDKLSQPDNILCSTALRTRQTLTIMKDSGLCCDDITFDSALYHASASYLWQSVQMLNVSKAMIVAHNPALAILMNRLVDGEHLAPELMHFPTGAIAVISFEADSFNMITDNTITKLQELRKGATL